jgi:hypothetical protein
MLIKQNGSFVKFAFTKENPNGLPAPVKKVVRGKEEWDWSETETFLWDLSSSFFEQFEGDDKPAYQEEDNDEEPDQFGGSNDPLDSEDDLPF